jgi:hypothetical protein
LFRPSWSLKGGKLQSSEIFAKFHQSPLFAASRRQCAPGWGNGDIVTDWQFVSPDGDGARPYDLRLLEGSPAAHTSIALPADWPDPLRPAADVRPDMGALPIGADAPASESTGESPWMARHRRRREKQATGTTRRSDSLN